METTSSAGNLLPGIENAAVTLRKNKYMKTKTYINKIISHPPEGFEEIKTGCCDCVFWEKAHLKR